MPEKNFLILDNLRAHHSKPIKKWLGENKEKIEVFYGFEARDQQQGSGSHKGKIESCGKQLQNPERVRSYFRDPRVA